MPTKIISPDELIRLGFTVDDEVWLLKKNVDYLIVKVKEYNRYELILSPDFDPNCPCLYTDNSVDNVVKHFLK